MLEANLPTINTTVMISYHYHVLLEKYQQVEKMTMVARVYYSKSVQLPYAYGSTPAIWTVDVGIQQ